MVDASSTIKPLNVVQSIVLRGQDFRSIRSPQNSDGFKVTT